MKLRMIVLLAAVPLAGCATAGDLWNGETPMGKQILAQRKVYDANQARYTEQNKRDQAALIAKGAMDPWDRLEVNAYRAYMDAKYGETPVMDGITIEESNKTLNKSKPK